MDYYPYEQLASAVRNLVGPEPIEERLRLAYVPLLKLDRILVGTTEDRDQYVAIMKRLAPDPEDRFSAIGADEARSLAREILALYESVVVALARDDLQGEMWQSNLP